MTAVNDAILALVAKAEVVLPAWQVLDGDTGVNIEDRVLLIGFNPVIGAQVVISNVDVDEGGINALLETLTVSCSAAAFDGNAEYVVKRTAVADGLQALKDALATDQKLGGVAYDAWIAPDAQWYQQFQPATADGPNRFSVQADFAITVRVFAE